MTLHETLTAPAEDVIRHMKDADTKDIYLVLVQIGTTKFDPPATIEAIDRVSAEGPALLDPAGTDIHLSVWMGLERAHAMVGITVDQGDPITVAARNRGSARQ